jgi:transposase
MDGHAAASRAIAACTARGSRFAERLLTVVASCRQQGRPVLDCLAATVEAALRGSSPPSLLLAGQGG